MRTRLGNVLTTSDKFWEWGRQWWGHKNGWEQGGGGGGEEQSKWWEDINKASYDQTASHPKWCASHFM